VQPPVATIEPPAVSAPVNVVSVPMKAEPLPPLRYGMHLVADLGNIIRSRKHASSKAWRPWAIR
jgi:hypothetical protein